MYFRLGNWTRLPYLRGVNVGPGPAARQHHVSASSRMRSKSRQGRRNEDAHEEKREQNTLAAGLPPGRDRPAKAGASPGQPFSWQTLEISEKSPIQWRSLPCSDVA